MTKRARIWGASVCMAILVLGLVAPTLSSATTVADWGPGFKGCGSFDTGHVHVFAENIGCTKARRIQKEYWLAPKSRTVEVTPPSGPPEVRLKRFPGWICASGSGGGSCVKGDKVAAYSD